MIRKSEFLCIQSQQWQLWDQNEEAHEGVLIVLAKCCQHWIPSQCPRIINPALGINDPLANQYGDRHGQHSGFDEKQGNCIKL